MDIDFGRVTDALPVGGREDSVGDEPIDVPEELPDSVDEAALQRMRAVARIMDGAVEVPGTNYTVGLDPLLGVVPGVGDALSAAVSLYVVVEAANLGVPYTTVVRMLANVSVDAAVGTVPVVGAIFDLVWKANERNLAMVERHLADERHTDVWGERGIVIEVEGPDAEPERG